jgi:hypothetical protein
MAAGPRLVVIMRTGQSGFDKADGVRTVAGSLCGRGAIGFFVETGGDGGDGVGQESVVVGDGMVRRDLTVESWVSMGRQLVSQ